MTITHLLEDFSTGVSSGDVMTLMSDVALEDQRLASFEQGYSAGWEDAFTAQDGDQTRITGNLASSLGDLSFTYHEALAQLLISVEPVFQSLVDLVLPDIMALTFSQHIVEQLCELVRDQAAGPVTLTVPLGASAGLAPILAKELAMPVEISEDARMAPGQAYLRLGATEREIDSAALLDSIRDAVGAFIFQINKEQINA